MYNKYFGFAESPFENSLDQKFLFLSLDHREVLAALLYFVKARKSFAMVCGDVGTGKTMLINSFLTRLPESVLPVMVSTPYVSSEDLLQTIAGALHIKTTGQERLIDLTNKPTCFPTRPWKKSGSSPTWKLRSKNSCKSC
jgi:general secretion pathway protein A